VGRSEQFLEALRSRVLVGDGAMGTALRHRGVGPDECFEALNTTDRTAVREILESYVDAGSDVIETNTFRGNRAHLEKFGLADKVFAFNYRGARLARTVAGRRVFVAGSVGPLGSAGPDAKEMPDARRVDLFAEQMRALAAGGVDLFLLETFTNLAEIRAAIRGARRAAKSIPVIAQMAFYEGQGSLGGVSIGAAIEEILAEGADGLGVNCGRGFADALAVVEKMAALTDVPISAYPNAGLPELRDGRLVYEQPVSYMADMAARMADAGANLIGGCCGTDERAIAAIAARVRDRPLARRRKGAAIELLPPPREPAVARTDPRQAGFLARMGKEPLIVVELDPPRGMLTDKVVEGARLLRSAGAHLVSMAENPLASIRMGNVGMAYVVRRDAGAEPLVHFTGRDRNTLGLHSDLMGAAALGIRHVLAITGDPAGSKEGGATSVYDVNSIGLVRILAALNSGRTMHGVDIGMPTAFTIGVAFNPNFRTMTGQVKKLQQKVEAGAHFALTQLVFDEERIGQVREATDPCGIPVLPGVMPLVSLKNALFIRNEVPGVTVPDEVIAKMEARPTGDAARKTGLDIARRLLKSALRSGAPGVYIVAPFNRADLAAELVQFVRDEWRA
jgi:methionine synthase / methylenetetrahydrofolate reductase (NADH)